MYPFDPYLPLQFKIFADVDIFNPRRSSLENAIPFGDIETVIGVE